MKWKIFSFLIALTFVLAACGGNGDDNGNGNQEGQGDNGGTNVENTRFNADNDANQDGNNLDQNGNNENQYELAEEAAEKIANQVDGIEDAYVLKTDNNAYVAAQLDNNNNNNNNGNNNNNNNGVDDNQIDGDQNNGFGMNGNEGNTDANTNGLNGNNGNNNGLTNNGAFGDAGDKDNGNELTDDVKQEISKIVKSVDNDVNNVYVSTNPDFFNLANNYADDAGNGEPVEGLFDQMGNMIERVFPQNKE
ncbi:YhcN/YlaJ family sporulation lipoprotein [Virgibacillus doumboii]|uniref:YhcN/YlaJ family sporulation lipoprotein n=1 Tax=Virgibacillus doumboii TaxID=2697503 RepID=UPI0013DFB24A|nr:YhcN/YlaJ family sporulation lipoprotein [Virgibacillus doumboii]